MEKFEGASTKVVRSFRAALIGAIKRYAGLIVMLCCIALVERIPLRTTRHLPDETVFSNALVARATVTQKRCNFTKCCLKLEYKIATCDSYCLREST